MYSEDNKIMKDNKRVKIKDVAELAKVSIATVSKVLNGKDEHISMETRQLIKQVVRETGYIPNDMARQLKQSNSKTIGLILPDISNAFPEMAKGAEDEATSRGYSVFFCSTNNNPVQEERCINQLISKMVDGIIYVSSNQKIGEQIIRDSSIPYVAIDREFSHENTGGEVRIDNYQAMKEVAEFLVKSGCKKIGYVAADISISPCKSRFEGLCDGLRGYGIEFDKKLLYTGMFNVETGYMGALALLERCKDIDCIACGNDLIAIGVMNVCMKMNISMPDQIKIIGFDDIYLAKYLNPELTTVRQNPYEMGRLSAQMLIDHFEYGKPLQSITLKHELIQRASV